MGHNTTGKYLKKSGLERESNPRTLRYRCNALPTELVLCPIWIIIYITNDSLNIFKLIFYLWFIVFHEEFKAGEVIALTDSVRPISQILRTTSVQPTIFRKPNMYILVLVLG